MESSKPVGTLVDESAAVSRAASELLNEGKHTIYRIVLEFLLYNPTGTKLDLLAISSILLSFVHEQISSHIFAAIWGLRCLNGTEYAKLSLTPDDINQLTVFVDASCGKAYDWEQRSRSGLLVKLEDAVVAVASILQKAVSLSSAEAEYVALNEAFKSIL